jgi:iron complex transport system permease protein
VSTRAPLSSTLLLAGVTALVALFAVLHGLPEPAAAGSADTRAFVLWELRVPRVLLGLLVGSTLGLVGASFQTLFQNPLAAPSTLGTTAGATVGALGAVTLGLEGLGFLSSAALFAFVGATVASLFVLAVASSGRARIEGVLLAGIAVTLAAGALSQALHSLADAPQLFAAAQWSLGQLPQVGYDRVAFAALPCLAASAVLLSLGRALLAMSLGEAWAQSMGVSTARVRRLTVLAGCAGVGVVVALAGPIAFVGLVVPHAVRPLTRGNGRWLFPLSWIGGAGFLVTADLLARTILPGRELPVGALTATIGAPLLFLVILGRQERG